MFDLILRNGRVLDPGQGIDRIADIGFRDGKVAAVEPGLPVEAAKDVQDATGLIVTPGLIDLHTHVYWGGTSLGVDADAIALRGGTTTFVDAGSAGAGNFAGFRRHVIERSQSRILCYLNISFAGIYGFSKNVMVGECSDIRLCDAREAVACGREHSDLIVGMKVRIGRIAGGTSGVAPLDIMLEAADRLQLPCMTHLDYPPPGRIEVIPRLRPGDVLTHCYKPFPNDIRGGDGHVRAEIKAARERGIIFDIGHGMGALDYEVARAMIAEGFLPDTISSDVHTLCVDGPAFDLLRTLSKFICLGMSLEQVVTAATSAPARAIGRSDLGSLAVGAIGDATVLRDRSGSFDYVDSLGRSMTGNRRLFCQGLVRGGIWTANEEQELA
ncbi:MAG TPA: amidohydrolase/deacetylase family metallohydrolase [Geminicoccus sp.]|uniref:amidohydrolase/deacetylase family metallohydrolase n=1 Tax=Geminicoccus sp. TaxID=2024832 RepID=UPI002E2F2532|nr:amidohydrolase/deacetylase family metallohydrolase [Geminicoccus sp.]HEX2527921.1 amidohydrolase/deacetylase family metallohydrolase [Geminicoccus sp.]